MSSVSAQTSVLLAFQAQNMRFRACGVRVNIKNAHFELETPTQGAKLILGYLPEKSVDLVLGVVFAWSLGFFSGPWG